MDIIEVIAKALESISLRGITVVQGWYDKDINDTHITFCLLNDNSNNISDDEEEEVSYIVQVDIWSKKDEWNIETSTKYYRNIKASTNKVDSTFIIAEDETKNDSKKL